MLLFVCNVVKTDVSLIHQDYFQGLSFAVEKENRCILPDLNRVDFEGPATVESLVGLYQ